MPHPGSFTPGNDSVPIILKIHFYFVSDECLVTYHNGSFRTFLAEYFVLIVVTLCF